MHRVRQKDKFFPALTDQSISSQRTKAQQLKFADKRIAIHKRKSQLQKTSNVESFSASLLRKLAIKKVNLTVPNFDHFTEDRQNRNKNVEVLLLLPRVPFYVSNPEMKSY